LTVEQVTELLQAAQGHPLEAFVTLALTGMRYSEMLALEWSDIDFEHGCLQVRRTVVFVASKHVVGAPKTKESQRNVMLPPFVVEALLRHRERQQETRTHVGEQWQNHDLVFCNPTGNFLNPMSHLDLFQGLLISAGLPRIRIHDLRQTACVWMGETQT